jgi:hypothetical protein
MERQAPEIMRNRDATLKRIEGLQAQEQQLTKRFRRPASYRTDRR